MSHLKERKEKICLNCKAEVIGRFCHVCGQENIEPKESFGHLVKHFLYHEFHFDGKFFVTVKDLLLKPGFLSKEYMLGRRVAYLDPIRMYIFISAMFFLFLFSVIKPNESIKHNINSATNTEKLKELLEETKDSLQEGETLSPQQKIAYQDKIQRLEKDINFLKKDSTKADSLVQTLGIPKPKHNGITISGSKSYASLHEYDSLQKALPKSQKDNFISQYFTRRMLERYEEAGNKPENFLIELIKEAFHSISEMLFVSLPFFALILQLLYVRKRREYYYVNHFIFTVHLYCGAFILLFLILALEKIKDLTTLHWLNFLELGILVYWVYFIYKSLRNFYGQSTKKTFVKFAVLNVLSFIMIMLLFCLFLFIEAVVA